MDDVLTIQRIEKLCEGEWVLVGDPELDEHFEVIKGTVLAHSPDRDEVYSAAVRLRPTSSAMLCFAKIPEGMGFLL
jgi:hypothetical protein